MDIHNHSAWQVSPASYASTQPAAAARPGNGRSAFADAVDRGAADVQPAPPSDTHPAADALREHVDTMRQREHALDAMVGDGTSPVTDQRDLLRLQSAVYRHAQQVDIATRVVDRATGTVRQMLMIQV